MATKWLEIGLLNEDTGVSTGGTEGTPNVAIAGGLCSADEVAKAGNRGAELPFSWELTGDGLLDGKPDGSLDGDPNEEDPEILGLDDSIGRALG